MKDSRVTLRFVSRLETSTEYLDMLADIANKSLSNEEIVPMNFIVQF
jgi:hypothetical protein